MAPIEHAAYIWLVLRQRSDFGTRYDTSGDMVLVKTSTKDEAPSVPAGCVLTRVKIVVPDAVLHPPLPDAQTIMVERNQAEIDAVGCLA